MAERKGKIMNTTTFNQVKCALAVAFLACDEKNYISAPTNTRLQLLAQGEDFESNCVSIGFYCVLPNDKEAACSVYINIEPVSYNEDSYTTDEQGNVYRQYVVKPELSWASYSDTELNTAKGRAELFLYAATITEKVCKDYTEPFKVMVRTAEQEKARKEVESKKKAEIVAKNIARNTKNLRVSSCKKVSEDEAHYLPLGSFQVDVGDSQGKVKTYNIVKLDDNSAFVTRLK